MIRWRSTRLTQPAGYSHLDLGSPLTSGLAFALSGVDGRDRVRGGAITRTASLSTGVTRHGFGFSSAANSAFSRALDLSGTSEITVSFVLVLRASTTAVLVEHTPTYNTNAGSFLVYTDGGNFFAGVSNGGGGATGYNVSQCAAPALNTTVRVVVTLRRIGTSAKACRIWFDGVEQATTQPNNGAISGNFANSTSYFLGRGASSLFANAIIQDPVIYGRLLSDSDAALLSQNPWKIYRPTERSISVPTFIGGGGALDASASMSTAPASVSASGVLPIAGTASLTAASATMAATGSLPGGADAAMATAPAALSASGALAIQGAAAMSTLAAMVAATGSLPNVASGSMATSAAVMSADGVLGSDATASASMTAAPATLASSGALSITASASMTTSAASMAATGDLAGQADGSASMSTAPSTVAAQGLLQLLAAAGMQTSTPILVAFGSEPSTGTAIDWSAPGARALVPQASVRAITPAANVRAIVPYAGADMDIIKAFDHQAGDTEIYELSYGPKYLDPLSDTPATLAAFNGGHTGITPEVVVGQPSGATVKFAVDGTVPVGNYVVSAQLATAAGRKKTAAVQVNVET